ncbi:MAG: DUF2007 domain-containing protein [Anaerolineae bacterium]|nr:DUF2007 domain-containing protein [Thermoflexales bacterium]MDW8406763.1 DUF2007 domain-containing protein [Anaerolineae bacterium]
MNLALPAPEPVSLPDDPSARAMSGSLRLLRSNAEAAAATPGGADVVRWVVIAVVGWAEAEVLRSKLEASGIPCLLQREAAGAVFGITIGALGEVRVLVPQHLAQQAIELLNDVGAAESDELDDGDWDDDDVEGERKADSHGSHH